jgi:hypothetical protein
MRSIREFLETIGFRGLVIGIGMTLLCLTAAQINYVDNDNEAALLWCLVLGLLGTMSMLLWHVNRMADLAAHQIEYERGIGWEIGYLRGAMDEALGWERADNPFVMDYEGRGED